MGDPAEPLRGRDDVVVGGEAEAYRITPILPSGQKRKMALP